MLTGHISARTGRIPPWPWSRHREALRTHLANPLHRNAYALMMNTGVTGTLGLFYWVLVARLYSPADVGRASAAYAAMNLLAGIAALSLTGALTRFLPQAGGRTRGLVTRAYAVSVAASATMTVLFLLAVGRLGPTYAELRTLGAGVAFATCVAAWVLFTLQDSVLTGLRGATWVLAENGTFGLVKIALVVALATALPHLGIDVSWMLPVFVAVPLVNALIFGRLVPTHAKLTADAPPPTGRQIGRFLAGDYTGSLALLATGNLVPVLVASRLAPRLTAYFFMAWAVGGVLELLAVNMAMSLTVEGAFDSSTLSANGRAVLRRMAAILVPCAVIVALLARWGLGLFGPGYAAHSAVVLEFLAFAIVPQAPVELYLGMLRAQSRTSRVALVQALRCALVLGLTVTLLSPLGLAGAGLAFLVSQAAVAVLIAPGLWRALSAGRVRSAPRPGGVAAGGAAARTASAAPRPPAGWRARLRVPPAAAAVGALAAGGVVMFFGFLRGIDLHHMNGLGLISVLPAGSLAGVTLVAFAVVAGIALPRSHPVLLGAALTALLVCLDGVTAVAETLPRFPTAYQITGYIDFIAKTGHAAPGLEAYFSWPGFFAFFAYLLGATGQHSLLGVLKLWPVTVDLLSLPPLFLIMRNLRISWRARWLAGFFFTVGNWVGQDYFSPQAFGFLLYLVFVAILVNWFTALPAPRRPGVARILAPWSRWQAWLESRPWPGWLPWPDWLHWPARFRPRRLHRRVFGVLQPGERPAQPATTSARALLLALLLAIYVATTTSHQFTPFCMLGACVVLVAIRRCTLTGLPVLLGVIVVGWLSYAAVAYWSGHMANIFGDIGHIGGNVSLSVSARMAGNTARHREVLEARVAAAGLMVVLAGLGMLRRRLRHFDDRVLIALACMPVPSIVLQNYGGEMLLRIYLFMLPAAAILAACLFFPGPQPARGHAWRWLPVLAVCALVLPAAFFVTRYGNESFERTPTGELTAMNYLYSHAGNGARVLWLSEAPATDVTPQMPWQYQDLATVNFVPEKAPPDPASTSGLISALRRGGPGTYLVTMNTQMTFLEEAAGYAPGWGRQFRAHLAAAPGVRVAFADASAVIYTLRFGPHAPSHLGVVQTGPAVPASGWTPPGLAVLWLLIIALTIREFTRVCVPGADRALRLLTRASWPLLAITAVIVAIRFVVL